jgi:hypothetical protein
VVEISHSIYFHRDPLLHPPERILRLETVVVLLWQAGVVVVQELLVVFEVRTCSQLILSFRFSHI